MRLRNIPRAKEVLANSPLVIRDPKEQKGRWRALFGNENPVYVEVGMGKGQFLTEMARRHREISYIGIERYSSVLLRAVEKLQKEEIRPKNLYFICIDAAELLEIFAPGEVSGIYLNFSDPWPKDRHARRRLTSRQFLLCYERILAPGGWVEFKTDNRALFDFSLKEQESAGWVKKLCTCDLHADEKLMEENVMTEYEEKFSALGNPICKLVMAPGPDGPQKSASDGALDA